MSNSSSQNLNIPINHDTNKTNLNNENNSQLDNSHNSSSLTNHSIVQDSTHIEHKPDESAQIMGSLGDHSTFTWSNYSLFELPYIFVEDGLHIYPNEAALNSSGLFKTEEHHGHKTVISIKKEKELIASKKQFEPSEVAPNIDLSITNFIAFEFIAVIILSFLFIKASMFYKKNEGKAPRGLANLIELGIEFVRTELVEQNLPTKKITDRYLPYFVVLFFFIFTLNFLGMLPGAHTATSGFWINAAFAVTALIMINYAGIKEGGASHYIHHLATGGAPWYMIPIMLPLEVLSNYIIKPFVLTMRLFANMTAGHLILAALAGVIIISKNVFAAFGIVPFSVFILVIEVLVCFLQAFVFTMLTSIFMGLAIGDHPKELAHHH